MEDFKYIAETEDFIFYRNESGEELTMTRKADGTGEMFGVSEFVENTLLEAIQKDELTKIDPSFAYDYLEIKKQVEEEEQDNPSQIERILKKLEIFEKKNSKESDWCKIELYPNGTGFLLIDGSYEELNFTDLEELETYLNEELKK